MQTAREEVLLAGWQVHPGSMLQEESQPSLGRVLPADDECTGQTKKTPLTVITLLLVDRCSLVVLGVDRYSISTPHLRDQV